MKLLWTYFPKNQRIPDALKDITDVFNIHFSEINSKGKKLVSDEVLSKISKDLELKGYEVERTKKKQDKISVPVLYGECGKIELSFEVDAYNKNEKIVVEVEAGRAVTNYQFLKDFFEACMMQSVEYLCIAARQDYRKNNDYLKICDFMNTMFLSDRLNIPLKGILIIGY